MKKFKFTIGGNNYDVNIENIDSSYAQVNVNGKVYEVELEKEIKTTKTPTIVRPETPPSTDSTPSTIKTHGPSEHKGTGLVKSPLPCIIREVIMKKGQMVKIGDTLLVLEAMKMENNIISDKEGMITEIKVATGDSVLEGDVLVVIN